MSVLSKPGVVARRLLPCALLGVPIVPLVAWSDEGSQVGIDNFKFAPTPLTIGKGTEVTWTNHDDIPHSIVLNSAGVWSKTIDIDGTFTYKFVTTQVGAPGSSAPECRDQMIGAAGQCV